MGQTTNSLRVRNLHETLKDKEYITLGSLCYWLELLTLVQSSRALDESARKDVFETLLSGIVSFGSDEEKTKYGEMQRSSWSYVLEKEVLEKLFERLSKDYDRSIKRPVFALVHIFNGCEYALQENFDPDTNEEIEKLLEILDRKLSNE